MYEVQWDADTGGLLLTDPANDGINSEVRPVFHEELSLLGFDKVWTYPKCEEPLLWAAGRRYFYKGDFVAEAKGGRFFEAPQLVFHKKDLILEPVDMPRMLEKNAALLRDLVQEAIEFICDTREREAPKNDITSVAFSGGKDSLVLLDLVQRALRPDEFVVVFNDTGMEIAPTLEAVKAAQKRWSNLTFYTSRSHMSPQQSWTEFGPPSRIHRWCCAVHKSVPNLLLLRRITRNPQARVLVYDGIRRDESVARSGYRRIIPGGKHECQTNASPLLYWNAAEVFLYLLQRRILLNTAYKYGFVRVGCSVCPVASNWWESLSWLRFFKDCEPMLRVLFEYSKDGNRRNDQQKRDFIASGAWKARGGGRNIIGYAKVTENNNGDTLKFAIRNPSENWLEWAKVLGEVSRTGLGTGMIALNNVSLGYSIDAYDNAIEVAVDGIRKSNRFQISLLRAIAQKTGYCVHCRACEVECPVGAITVRERVSIDEMKCIHCFNCLTFEERKGCLAAKSLEVSQEGRSMKGINRYQHFGVRKEWLEEYLRNPAEWWRGNSLGNRQFDAMRIWLKEAEVITNNELTLLGKKLVALGSESDLTWYIIWANLARNSALLAWYLGNVEWGSELTKNDLVSLMGGGLTETTRKNGITSLVGLLRDTPLGNKLGLGVIRKDGGREVYIQKIGKGIETDPVAVLYGLYRYAERIDRYDLSLGELYQNAEEGPYYLFGVQQEDLRQILTGLASRFPEYLSVEFVKDLDNIFIFREHSALEVLDGCTES